METFKPPKEMVFSAGNIAEQWRRWYQKFDNFMLATEFSNKSDVTKIAVLLNVIGDEGVEIYNTFRLDESATSKYEAVVKKFDEYCAPRKNVVCERFKFFSCSQQEGQMIDSYVTQLKTLAADCEFADQEEGLLRDRVVLGIRDSSLQEMLLREPNLSLKKAAEYVRAAEIGKVNEQQQINEPSTSTAVSTINKSQMNYKKGQNSKTKKLNLETDVYDCSRCGKRHARAQCPAYGKTCNQSQNKKEVHELCNEPNGLNFIDNIEISSIEEEEMDSKEDNGSATKFFKELFSSSTHTMAGPSSINLATPSKFAVENTKTLSPQLQESINSACEECGIDRHQLNAFLIRVKKICNPSRIARYFTKDPEKLKTLLVVIKIKFNRTPYSGTKEDKQFIQWITRLVKRFEGPITKKRKSSDQNNFNSPNKK